MIAQVAKIKIIVPHELKEDTLNLLAELKCFDFSAIKALAPKNLDDNNLVDTLTKIAGFKKKNNANENISKNQIYTFDVHTLIVNYNKYLELTKKLDELLKELNEINKFKNIKLAQSNLLSLRLFKYFFCQTKNSEKNKVLKALKKIGLLIEIFNDGEDCVFGLVYPEEKINALNEIIQAYQLKKFEIKDKSPYQRNLELKKEIIRTKKNLKKLEEYLSSISEISLANKINEFKFIREKSAIIAGSKSSSFFIYFEGFILKDKLIAVQKNLEKKIKHFYLAQEDFDPKEAPVYLKNKMLVKPFELITYLFGSPHYAESDPTPFLMPFFTIYFGFTLSEAGYGLIMVIMGIILLMIRKFKPISYLLILCGFSTIVFGFILGSLFGLNIGKINPQTDPVYVLKIALALGMIHIALSYLMKFFNALKNKQPWEGIRNGLIWAVIMITFVFWFVLSQIFAMEYPSTTLITRLLIAQIILLIGLYAINSSNKILGVLKGIGSLYSFVGIFSDILSYSRLLALGLATGVIAATINLLAGLFKDMVPIFPFNYIIFGGVLIVGHIFNLAINILGSFIHSSRLQFVESFSKFFEGGGNKFVPLSKPKRFQF